MDSLKKIAEQTLHDLEAGYYVNRAGQRIAIKEDVQHSIDNSRHYSPADLDGLLSRRSSPTAWYNITTTRASTLQCLRSVYADRKKVALLNFASAKNPGGGFLGGSQAQEESLARSGGLYPTLLRNSGYYDANRRATNAMYTDNLIYSPQVVFFRNDDGEYLDQAVKADVITMPAVNKGALPMVDDKIQEKIDEVMKHRMRCVLTVSEENNVDVLILGAWGCGVFRNDPKSITTNFKEVLAEEPVFAIPQIIFAVIDRDGKTYDAFTELASKT